MALSWQESVYKAGSKNISVDIDYLDKSYIHVYLDDNETHNYKWASNKIIVLDTTLDKPTLVTLVRRTSKDFLYIKFADGAPFIRENLDTQNTQFLHLAQELTEGRSIEGFYGDISMNGFRIINMGAPIDKHDATTKGYVDSNIDSKIAAEEKARQDADTSLQNQITGKTPVLSAERSVVSWHGQTLDNSVEVPINSNAFSVGPYITIDPGQQVVVGNNSYWTILDGKIISSTDYDTIADTITTSDGTITVKVRDILEKDDVGTLAKQNFDAVNITGGSISGINPLAVADGGTGTTTAEQARGNLGAARSGTNSDITQLTKLNKYSPMPGAITGLPENTGIIGEILEKTQTKTSVSSNTPTDLVSLVLTPGDWEVRGMCSVRPSNATVTRVIAGTVTDSGNTPVFPSRVVYNGSNTTVQEFPVPTTKFNISKDLTIYLTATVTFTDGSVTGDGYLCARRVR